MPTVLSKITNNFEMHGVETRAVLFNYKTRLRAVNSRSPLRAHSLAPQSYGMLPTARNHST